MNNKRLGYSGEEFACSVLENKGYTIVKRNYSCKLGEIDIIALKDRVLYFVEVKTRQTMDFGYPCQAVGPGKIRHLRNTAMFFLERTKVIFDYYQFKIVEVYYNEIDGVV